MEAVYTRTKTLNNNLLGFCPGCMHGTVFKLIGEVLEEMGIDNRTTAVLGIGCCGLAQEVVSYDLATAPHGRAGAAPSSGGDPRRLSDIVLSDGRRCGWPER